MSILQQDLTRTYQIFYVLLTEVSTESQFIPLFFSSNSLCQYLIRLTWKILYYLTKMKETKWGSEDMQSVQKWKGW